MNLDALIASALAPLRTAAQYRAAAESFRRAARKAEKIATALEGQGRVLPGAGTARGQGRKPTFSLAILAEDDRGSVRTRVVIGKAAWHTARQGLPDAILSEQRIAVRWDSQNVWLEPCGWGEGYAVTIGSGSPRFYVGPEAREYLPASGRYHARVQDGRIYFSKEWQSGGDRAAPRVHEVRCSRAVIASTWATRAFSTTRNNAMNSTLIITKATHSSRSKDCREAAHAPPPHSSSVSRSRCWRR